MSLFANASARLNAAALRAAAVTVTYYQPGLSPIQIQAAYGMRDRNERGNIAANESVWTTLAQLALAPATALDGSSVVVDPQKGDTLTIGNANYVVFDVKPGMDPDDDSLSLYLKRGPKS